MRNPRPLATGRGFTFLELVVSLTLISLLTSLLFPVFVQTRRSARRASCQSNLGQLGAALHLYSHDHDGRFPATENDWTFVASVYAKNTGVLKCPGETVAEHKRFDPGTTRSVGGRPLIFSSYTYRPGLANDDPAEEPVSTDWRDWHDGFNVLYLGGNVRWKPAKESPKITA
ncbi:MAG: type II secretion system protein, partial [Actinomycetota bacterium]